MSAPPRTFPQSNGAAPHNSPQAKRGSPAAGAAKPAQQQLAPRVSPSTAGPGLTTGMNGGMAPAMTPQQQQQMMQQQQPMMGYGSMGPGAMNGMGGYGSMGPGQMGGGGTGSMYGNSMYGAGSMMGNNMYAPNGAAPMQQGGSMYGMGAGGGPGAPNSMYGPGNNGSMYGGSAWMGGRYAGSLYGGSFFGNTGSLYGQGGSLYGTNDMGSVMGSMYGMGSMYESGESHIGLGTVQKKDLGYSITFGSQVLGSTPSRYASYHVGDGPESSGSAALLRQHSLLQGRESDPTISFVTRRAKELDDGGEPAGSIGEAATATEAAAAESGSAGAGRSAATPSAATGAAATTPGGRTASRAIASVVRVVQVDEEAQAPRSPTSSSAPNAKPLSAEAVVQTVAVVERTTSSLARVKLLAESSEVEVDGKAGKQKYAFGEALFYDSKAKAAVIDSKKVADMLAHFRAGHNTSLLVAADRRAGASVNSLVQNTVKELFAALDKPTPVGKSKYFLDLTLCAINAKSEVKDLIRPAAAYIPLEVGGSPLFGPVVMDLETFTARSSDAFNEKFASARTAATADKATLVATIILKQINSDKSDKRDVFLSSLVIAVAPESDSRMLVDAAERTSESPLKDVLRYGLGGPCVTVAVLCIADTSEDCALLAGDVGKLGAVKNSLPRSGNVTRFLSHTGDVYTNLKAKAAKMASPDKEEMERNVERLGNIITDYKNFNSNPETMKPKVYRATRVEVKGGELTSDLAGSRRGRGLSGVSDKASANTAENLDNKIRTVLLVDDMSSAAYKVSTEAMTVTASGVSHPISEVKDIKSVTGTTFDSTSVQACVKSFVEGYNASVITMDSAKVASEPFASPSWACVREAVRAALAVQGTSKHLRVAIAVLKATGEAADLVNKSKTPSGAKLAWEPMVVASSPLFGPIVHNATLHDVTSEEGLGELIGQAKANLASSGLWGTDTVVFVSLVNSYATSGDCVVSCFSTSFAGPNHAVYDGAMGSNARLLEIFRYGFVGTAVTAAVLSITSKDEVSWVNAALTTLEAAGNSKKRAVRRGSLTTFVDFTASSIVSRRERMKTMTEASKIAKYERLIAPMEQMLADHQAVLKAPETNVPNAYAPDSAVAASPPRTATAAAAGDDSTRKSRAIPDGGAATTPAAAVSSAAAALSSADKTVVAFVPRAAATGGEKKLHVQGSDYVVYEVVSAAAAQRSSAVMASTQLTATENNFVAGRNCAMLSMSTFPGGETNVASEPALAGFAEMVKSAAAASDKAATKFSIDLVVYVASRTDVVADLQTAGMQVPRAMELGKSPLWGVRPTNVRSNSVNSAAMLDAALTEAWTRVTPAVLALVKKGEAAIIAHAVKRRATTYEKEPDADLFCLFACVTGSPSEAYQVISSENACPLLELTNATTGSSFSTVGVVNIGVEDTAETATMLGKVTAFVQGKRSAATRPQNIRPFLKATEGTIDKMRQQQAASPGESSQRRVDRYQDTLDQHKKLLADFNAPLPQIIAASAGVASSPARQPSSRTPQTAAQPGATPASPAGPWKSPTSSSDPNMCTTVGVVMPVCSLGGSVEAKVTDAATVTVYNGASTRACHFGQTVDGVAAGPGAVAAVLDTSAVAYLVRKVAGGNNGAMFLAGRPADANLAREVPQELVRRVVAAASSKRMELFYTILLIRGNDFKDVTDGKEVSPNFAAINMASSPLFGPVAADVPLSALSDAKFFADRFQTAYSIALERGCAVQATVVMKQMEDKDVCLNSLLIMSDPTGGSEMCPLIQTSHQRSRDLYCYALGGSCFTVGVLAMENAQDDGPGLEKTVVSFEAMASIKNSHLRSGSVAKFVAYASQSVKNTEDRAAAASKDKERAELEKRAGRYKRYFNDADNMMRDPANIVPPAYRLDE